MPFQLSIDHYCYVTIMLQMRPGNHHSGGSIPHVSAAWPPVQQPGMPTLTHLPLQGQRLLAMDFTACLGLDGAQPKQK